MSTSQKHKIGIIGAGVAGLGTAKTLLAEGFECTVFERASTLGGVWAQGYSNFGVQVQKELYEFPDWPLPDDVPDFTPGVRIQRYLEDYARHFGVWPHIRFDTSVMNVRRSEIRRGAWTVKSLRDGVAVDEEFDQVVVCVGLYSSRPHVPRFAGQDGFDGEIIHVSELEDRSILAGKKVAIVGYGKSATDAAVEAAEAADETSIIFREAHWPVPAVLLGILPFKWAMLGRLASSLLPPYYRPSRLEEALHSIGQPLVWLWWRIVELLLTLQCGLWSRFGTRVSLVPDSPVEIDTFGEAVMLPRPEFYRYVRRGRIAPYRTEIATFEPDGVRLTSGESIEVDMVILGTGWRSDLGFLEASIRRALESEEDGIYMYRQMVHPELPGLFFVGHASTIENIVTYNLQARWLCELLKGTHALPSTEHMRENIDQLRGWKRAWMPHSEARGARLLLHMQHYHDELLEDLGASPLRKTGVFAPLKEVFAPYEPRDYMSIVAGEQRRSMPSRSDEAA
ncbi:MAG: NAD(P)-binding domain-containing protein [Gemmatimonadota bacterium]|nr:NAD(P)-binding domain-containing protein [Gemmatimonadota bacterium]